MKSWQRDKQWSDSLIDQVKSVLEKHAGKLLSIQVAPRDEDVKHATDLIIKVQGGDVAVRLRRDCRYRDLTIRAKRDSNAPTELEKIKAGFAHWYFYGWTAHNKIIDWMLVDLDRLRRSGLLENRPLISNHDGTFFIAIPRSELEDCIIARYDEERRERGAE